jgi:hypothetical protein
MCAIFVWFPPQQKSKQKGSIPMKRWFVALLVVLVGTLASVPGCSKKTSSQSGDVALTKEAPENTAGGVLWSYPSKWTKAGPRAMRVVTYSIAPAQGDSEGGECAVSFFPSGAGGDIESNIQRWSGQFENAPAPMKKEEEVNGLKVAKVVISGNYLAPAGPMMESQGKKENFRLFGAIVEAPEGKVFFKFTGPAKTVEGAGAEFDALIGSIAKK